MGTRYDEIADFYDSSVRDDVGDSVAAAVFELAGDVSGLRVLELACGQGRVSRELARRGALVVGVDLSTKLLDKAQAAEDAEPLGITYLHEDVTSASTLAGERFDGVVCHFGLSDIDDLDGALATAARVLQPGGWFVFSIVHPCFPGSGKEASSSWPPGRGYFEEGWWLADSPGFRGKVGANHRMLSSYLNALEDHRLTVDRTAEPEPEPGWYESKGGNEPVPVYLVVRCRRA